ncbi:MAG: carbon-nitrogen hydrolase family protein [Planctomycetota bacterium]|nr:MAG: carbon-nitrogen hydrolase family protein [Planctomycetota bacterium]
MYDYPKIVIYQQRLGVGIPLDDLGGLRKKQPDILVLPEYFFFDSKVTSYMHAREHFTDWRAKLCYISDELECLLAGGTVIEPGGIAGFNTCLLIDNGDVIGRHRKMNPTEFELESGIIRGDRLAVFDTHIARIGILICADVLFPENFEKLGRMGAEIIICPVDSPLREGEPVEDKESRDREIFEMGAKTAGAYVLKACGIGTFFDKPIQGRSLVMSPWGRIAGVPYDEEDRPRIIEAELDLPRLRKEFAKSKPPSIY